MNELSDLMHMYIQEIKASPIGLGIPESGKRIIAGIGEEKVRACSSVIILFPVTSGIPLISRVTYRF